MGLPAFASKIATIVRDYIIDGNPGSGAYQPQKSDFRAWGGVVETGLNALFSLPWGLINGTLLVTVSGNILTGTIKTNAGADPSTGDPVYFVGRSVTATDGAYAVVPITGATSLSVTFGSTLGVPASTGFSLEWLGINDNGTFRLGVINRNTSGNVLASLDEGRMITTTAEGGAGGADSAGVIYTGTAVATARPFRVLARAMWFSGLGTPGAWSAAPDVLIPVAGAVRRPVSREAGHIFGLTLSNNVSDANNDIDIAAGAAIADGDPDEIVLAAAITKRSDAAWAVGSGVGGMDTGSKGTNATLALWLIKRSDTGIADVLFSASASAPTMPSGYDKKRRIGYVRTDGSGNILAFFQNGDTFTYSVPISDVTTTNPGTVAVLRTISVPPLTQAIFSYWLNNVTTAAVQVLLTETAQADTTPTTALFNLRATATSQANSGEFRRKVDASAQIRARHQASGASDALQLTTLGWVDTRGRMA